MKMSACLRQGSGRRVDPKPTNLSTFGQVWCWHCDVSSALMTLLKPRLRFCQTNKVRYERPTLTSKKLSSSFFQSLWVSVTWPDLHFFQYIKAWMPSFDLWSHQLSSIRLILTRYHQVSTIAVQYTGSCPRNAELSQLDLVTIILRQILLPNDQCQLRIKWRSILETRCKRNMKDPSSKMPPWWCGFKSFV